MARSWERHTLRGNKNHASAAYRVCPAAPLLPDLRAKQTHSESPAGHCATEPKRRKRLEQQAAVTACLCFNLRLQQLHILLLHR